MALEERDPHTGYLTTGHEWNGIKELNTPVPRAIYLFLLATAAFALLWWVLMPAWPLGATYSKGVLGVDQRRTVTETLQQAEAARADWSRRIEQESFAEIQADPGLMRAVRQTGRALFGDNCAVCHGTEASGGKGYPSLTAGSSLWGATPEAIAETIRVGVNSSHKDSRASQMPAFGRDRMLSSGEIGAVTAYVQSLSGAATADPKTVATGKGLFAANCAACHGDAATGNPDMGAPDLTDASWIYGGDRASLHETLQAGRQGHMPHWETRLAPVQRKILVLYLLALRAERK